MKLLAPFFILSMLVCISSGITAQHLEFVHGKRNRTIELGTFIQVEVPRAHDSICIKCPINTITGELISVGSDNLIVRVVESNEPMVDQGNIVGYTYKKFTSSQSGPLVDIPKADVLSIINKGKNRVHQMNPLDVVSSAIANLTIATLAFAALEGLELNDVATVAVYALAVSGIFSISRQPFFMTNKKSVFNNKKLIRELWVIK